MKPLLTMCLAIFLVACPIYFLAAPQSPDASAPRDAHAAKKIYVPGVPNAARVDEHLYRGAQPRGPGVRALKEMGITTIVDLRDEGKSKITWEQQASESLGMRFVNIPVNGWGTPSDQQASMFLAIFRANPQEKVFVHCRFGDDRTGMFVAMYRMAFDKYPASEALREMNEFGFNRAWHRNMSAFVREFPAHLESAPELAPFKSIP